MDEWKMRGSQIPAFGEWEYVNELPITQYFECARQAGLIRYSSSSGECNLPYYNNYKESTCPDLYAAEYVKPRTTASPPKQIKGRERRSGGLHGREGNRKQAGKVYDVTVTELSRAAHTARRHPPTAVAVNAVKKKQQQFQYDSQPRKAPKAVDEDLYKIPPELLKRKKRLGFFSRCLVPPCAV